MRERKCELVLARMWASAHLPSDVDAEILFHELLLVVAGPRSKWLGRRTITLAQIADEPWIVSPTEIESGVPMFEAFCAIGLGPPRARILSNSLTLWSSLLATGRFLTLVPDSVLRFGPARTPFKVLPVELPRWRLPTALLSLRNRTLSPAAQLFIDCVREIAKPLARPR